MMITFSWNMWGLLILLIGLEWPASSFASFHISGVPEEYTSNGVQLANISESGAPPQIIFQLAKAHNENDLSTELDAWSLAKQFIACTTCRATVDVLARTLKEDYKPGNDELFKKIVIGICERFQLHTPDVCSSMTDLYLPSMKYIIQNSKADARTVCSLIMDFSICPTKDVSYNWAINIDDTAGAVTAPKSNLPTKNGNELRILHLTDIHFDPLYAPGSLAECAEPQCCQRGAGSTESAKGAGYWGDYRDCDAPWHMIEDALKHIKKTHTKIDYIYQTGDLVYHLSWNTSEERNMDIATKVNTLLAEFFPGVPIYSCIGNHEPHPINLFSPDDAPEELNTHSLYENLYQQWSVWLPNDTKNTILKGGYYTVSPKTGFRVIALNNNECYTLNWWLFYEGTNKMPQLQWLHDTLLAAEKAGEYAHILAHIPTADSTCWSVWAREFNRLVQRFRYTISGIFNGHSHFDEMHLHYSEQGYAIGVAWNGGSLTPYSYKNPNYRLYHVETESMQVVDHETWIFNLTEANKHGASETPNWFKEYEFSTEFTVDMSPDGIDMLLDAMAVSPDILRKFWRYKMTTADPSLAKGCGRSCLLSTICRLATTVNNQKSRCKQLRGRLNAALDNESTTLGSTTETTALPTTLNPTEGSTEGNKVDGAASLGYNLTSLVLLVAVLFRNTYVLQI